MTKTHTKNEPLADAALAELDQLHTGLRGGDLIVQEQMDDGFALIDERGVCLATTMFLGDARFFAHIYSQYQPLRQRLLDAEARLAEAERERDHHQRWREDSMDECHALKAELHAALYCLELNGIADDAVKSKLAARDAQQRREGAAEWLEKFLAEWDTDATRDLVSIWDIQQAAKRLRKGGE